MQECHTPTTIANQIRLPMRAVCTLLMSSMGGRGLRPSDDEIFDDWGVCVRRISAVPPTTFSFWKVKKVQHTPGLLRLHEQSSGTRMQLHNI